MKKNIILNFCILFIAVSFVFSQTPTPTPYSKTLRVNSPGQIIINNNSTNFLVEKINPPAVSKYTEKWYFKYKKSSSKDYSTIKMAEFTYTQPSVNLFKTPSEIGIDNYMGELSWRIETNNSWKSVYGISQVISFNIKKMQDTIWAGDEAIFSAQITGDSIPSKITYYKWTVNGTVEGTEPEFKYKFMSPGSYTIGLSLAGSDGIYTAEIATNADVNSIVVLNEFFDAQGGWTCWGGQNPADTGVAESKDGKLVCKWSQSSLPSPGFFQWLKGAPVIMDIPFINNSLYVLRTKMTSDFDITVPSIRTRVQSEDSVWISSCVYGSDESVALKGGMVNTADNYYYMLWEPQGSDANAFCAFDMFNISSYTGEIYIDEYTLHRVPVPQTSVSSTINEFNNWGKIGDPVINQNQIEYPETSTWQTAGTFIKLNNPLQYGDIYKIKYSLNKSGQSNPDQTRLRVNDIMNSAYSSNFALNPISANNNPLADIAKDYYLYHFSMNNRSANPDGDIAVFMDTINLGDSSASTILTKVEIEKVSINDTFSKEIFPALNNPVKKPDLTISGWVTNLGANKDLKVKLITEGGAPFGETPVNSEGLYIVSNIPYGWTGSVRIEGPCYDKFEPSEFFVKNLMDSKYDQNFSANLKLLSVSGWTGIPNTQVDFINKDSGLLGSVFTDQNGFFENNNVPCGWSGTISITNDCYIISEPIKLDNITENMYNNNFTSNVIRYLVSGSAKSPYSKVTFTNKDGSILIVLTTNADGYYMNDKTPCGWSGTISAYNECYTFSQPIEINNLRKHLFLQNFTSTVIKYKITGWAGVANAVITFKNNSGTVLGTVNTNENGFYENKNVPCGWTGQISASKTGYTFSSPIQITDIHNDLDNQNFTAQQKPTPTPEPNPSNTPTPDPGPYKTNR